MRSDLLDTNHAKTAPSDSIDKKLSKPIIPKIKTSPTQPNNDHFSSSLNKSTVEFQKKRQKHPYSIQSHPQHCSVSNIKSLPKEQQLEKMNNKQLAQTYYQQFLRLFRQNEVLDKQLAFVRHERDVLYKRYHELKEEQKNSEEQRPKRQRRVATEIQRNFNCPVYNCDKSYGSEGSLIQHLKLKHEEFYGTNEYFAFLNKQKEDS